MINRNNEMRHRVLRLLNQTAPARDSKTHSGIIKSVSY